MDDTLWSVSALYQFAEQGIVIVAHTGSDDVLIARELRIGLAGRHRDHLVPGGFQLPSDLLT